MENLFQSLTQAAPVIAIFWGRLFHPFSPPAAEDESPSRLAVPLGCRGFSGYQWGAYGVCAQIGWGFRPCVYYCAQCHSEVRKSHITEVLSHGQALHIEGLGSEKSHESVAPSHTSSENTPKRKSTASEKKESSSKTAGRSSGKKAVTKNKKDQA